MGSAVANKVNPIAEQQDFWQNSAQGTGPVYKKTNSPSIHNTPNDPEYLEVGGFWLILLSSLLYLLLSPLAQWCARRWSLNFRQTRRTPRDKLDWLGLDWVALDSISIALDCVVYGLAWIELAMDWIVSRWIGLG